MQSSYTVPRPASFLRSLWRALRFAFAAPAA
jgi:hypothetical protein